MTVILFSKLYTFSRHPGQAEVHTMPPKKKFPQTQGDCGDKISWALCASGNCKIHIREPSGVKEQVIRLKNVTNDVTQAVAGKVRALGLEALLPSAMQTGLPTAMQRTIQAPLGSLTRLLM